MAAERIFIEPADRRQAILDVIGAARSRIALSLFRCNDGGVLDALAAAVNRGVKVEAILTRRAKGGRKRLHKLWKLLEGMGAIVHWYADPVVKYHAKYIVADDRLALIATLNPTTKCFTSTWDFVYTTEDTNVVRSVATLFGLDAAGAALLPGHQLTNRLIVGPEGARTRLQDLMAGAARSIRILDHKLSDPDVVAFLRERRAEGVAVTVIGRPPSGRFTPHGKLMLIDESRAVLGSMAASALSLDFRREVSVVIEVPQIVEALCRFYSTLIEHARFPISRLPGDDVIRESY